MTFDLRRRHRAPLRRHWRIARRDLRGSLGSFAIFFACTALGVATIATVGVLNAGITRTLERDASSLLGGDVEIEQPNNALADAEIDALVPAGARLSRTVRTNAIVFDAEGDSLAVELKAIDGAYPLYGGLETAPPGLRPGEGGALVEEGVLTRLGVEVGDTLELGSGRVTIDGVVRREPDRIGGYVGLGPRLMVDWRTLESLDVLVPGALARYGYRLALAEPDSAETVAADLQNRHPEATWRARSARDVQPRVARFTDRLATYLMMAGLTALVIGGLGIGLSVRAYLEGKTASIATLRSLGARAADITRIYGLQLGALAVGGTAIGVASGQALPFVLAPLASGLFPVDIEATIEPLPLLYAGACGLVTVALFAWLPLARCRDVSPAAIYRTGLEPAASRWRAGRLPLRLMGPALLALGLVALVVSGAPRVEIALVFVAAVVGVMVALALAARAFLWAAARARPFAGPRLAMALSTLGQPGQGAIAVVVALGAGLAALVMVGLVQDNLENELTAQLPERAPKLVFIDIQPHQKEAFEEVVARTGGASILQMVPVLRARVTEIAGQPVDRVEVAENVRWTVRRDRGLTWQAAMPEETRLVAGEWWPEDYRGPPLVSVEDEVAIGYGVGVGDTIAFNVLGRTIEATIANLREEIDWSRGRLAFVFVLSPGLIEQAPHTSVAALDLPDGAQSAMIGEMARALPNVTPISIGEAIARVDEIMGKIALAIRIVAGVTLATGLLVLAAAVVASRRQQVRRAVLLKVLGAARGDILRLMLLEHAGLGLIAAIVGSLLGALGAYLLIEPVMGIGFAGDPLLVGAISALGILLSAAVGLFVLRRALSVPAAAILRQA